MKIGTAISQQLQISLLLISIFSFSASADSLQSLKPVGQGKMSWFFMDIYQAALFSKDGQYQAKQYPQALTIRYQRDLSKHALLKATKQEWQKLSVDEDVYREWLLILSGLWPEIKDGDSLTFLVVSNGAGHFYHNGSWIGRIDNPAFSDAFLAIWLSENTSEPGLRRKLIGEVR